MQTAFQPACDTCTVWSWSLSDHPPLHSSELGSAGRETGFLTISASANSGTIKMKNYQKIRVKRCCRREKQNPLRPSTYFKIKKQTKLKLIDKYSEGELKTRKFVRVLGELHYILTKILPYQVYWDRAETSHRGPQICTSVAVLKRKYCTNFS